MKKTVFFLLSCLLFAGPGFSGLLAQSGSSSAAPPVSTTICQAQSGGSYCSDGIPGPADGAGYHDLVWVNLNKVLVSIAVSDDQVWGLDQAQVLWFLPNFKTGTTWMKVASGVAQISAGHNLFCQINSNQHVYCSLSPNPAAVQADANGYHSVTWIDTGVVNFQQIAVSAGSQFWGIDTGGNLVQVKDFQHVASTSTLVASGVRQVAVDGRGQICQVNSDNGVYCSNWAMPPAQANVGNYHGLSWFRTGASLQNISVADGQVYGTDGNGNVWEVPDYTNSGTWFRIAYGGVGDQLSGASAPSQFAAGAFASDEVAVLLFMGQSNAVGINPPPLRLIAPSSPNVWGIKNGGWNFLVGNSNGTTPYSGAISSIGAVQWTNWSLTPNGPDMNLGFTSGGTAGNAANFAAFQWQGLINAGWSLPDLYVVDIGWPSQGVDASDTPSANAAWTENGVNLWQPGLTTAKMPSYALAPFARRMAYLGLKNILAQGKTPRVLGLQWNQWEAEAGNANPVSLTDAPSNYTNLFNGFYAALGSHYPIQLVKPLSTAYGSAALASMQTTFAKLVSNDPTDFSLVDVSQVSSTIFSGGVLGGGDGSVHYNLDTHMWFATQAIAPCLLQAKCGTRITTMPTALPN